MKIVSDLSNVTLEDIELCRKLLKKAQYDKKTN